MPDNKKARGRQVDPQTMVEEIVGDTTARETLVDDVTYNPGIVTGLNQNLQDALNVKSAYSGYYNDGEGAGSGPTDYKGASSTGNVQYTQLEMRTAQGHFQVRLFDGGVAQSEFRLGQLLAAPGDSQSYIKAVENLLLLTTLDGDNGKLEITTEGDGSDLEISATGDSSDVVITSSTGDVIVTSGGSFKVRSNVLLGTSGVYTADLNAEFMTRPASFRTSSNWLLAVNVAGVDFSIISGLVTANNSGPSTKYYADIPHDGIALWVARGVPAGASLVGVYVEFDTDISATEDERPFLQLVRFRGAGAGSSSTEEGVILESTRVAAPVGTPPEHRYAEIYYGGPGPGVLIRTSSSRPPLSSASEWLSDASVSHESRPSFGGSGNIRSANYQFGLEIKAGASGVTPAVLGVVFVFELKQQVP